MATRTGARARAATRTVTARAAGGGAPRGPILSVLAVLAVLPVFLVLLAPAPARAYVRTVTSAGRGIAWPTNCARLQLNLGALPRTINRATFLRASREAVAVWGRGRLACSGLDLRIVASEEGEAAVGLDGTNRVMFRRNQWCKEPRADDEACYDPSALAITSTFAELLTGALLDADIEINAVNATWADLGGQADGSLVTHDLQNALTHEVGHFVGLDHTCWTPGTGPQLRDDQGELVPNCLAADGAVRATTMFVSVAPGDLERRSLSEDDQRGVCELYPAAKVRSPFTCEATPPPQVVGGGCALAGGPAEGARGASAGLAAALLATTALAGRARRRRRPPPRR
jgi:hypothetical protein